jgi:NAD-dependent dihydropyrimidine dehydrogenase PreA subunit
MGHLTHLKREHRDLVSRLGRGQVAMPEPDDPRAREGWQQILEILYTPEQAAFAARMPVAPATLDDLERRFGMARSDLDARLDEMCNAGLVFDLVHPETGEVKYVLAPPVVGFFELSMMRAHTDVPQKRLAEALEAYTHGDDTFAREVFGHETTIGRTVAHESAIADDLPEVLDWERATALIDQSRQRAVSLCYCRHKAEHLGSVCSAPQEMCLSLDAGADFVVRRGFGRAIEVAEAREILAGARARGLVQIADNVQRQPSYVCNCCACCCEQLRAARNLSLLAVTPSGFVPEHDPDKCRGCSRCARACPVLAITMIAKRAGAVCKNDLVPVVDFSRCIGCGVCSDACSARAIRLGRRPDQPRVPSGTVERAVRMALERGRIGHLFDEGAALGGGMLGRLLAGLFGLGAVHRLLAVEQLRSRFVRRAIATVRDPTG